MKQYRNLMIIIVGICLCFSTFYINKAFSTSDFPEYSIKKVSGEEDISKNIKLKGYYNENSNLTITHSGSTYDSELSFFKQIDALHYEDSLDSYQKKYPSFMRGKTDPRLFFVNKNQLVYVNLSYKYFRSGIMSDFVFKVSTLNTKTKESTTFKLPLSNQKNVIYSNIVDVRVVNNHLKIITQNEIEGNNEEPSTIYKIYTVDLTHKKIIEEDHVGDDVKAAPGEYTNYHAISEMSPFQDSDIFLYEIVREKHDENGELSNRTNDLYVYNLRTKEQQALKLPS